MSPYPVALCCADLHQWHVPPVSRAAEVDWWEAMRRPLRQLRRLQIKHGIPVIYVGDVTDRSNATPELIWFMLHELVDGYAVAGQHDLEHHNLENVRKTGFGTLVKAGKLTWLEPGKPVEVPGRMPLRLHGFNWGEEIKSLEDPHDMMLEIAVIHRGLWQEGTGHPESSDADHQTSIQPKLKGYAVAVFGDNHQGFTVPGTKELPVLYNCGTLIRRTSKERELKPAIGIICSDGSVVRKELDCSLDAFSETTDVPVTGRNFGKVIEGMNELGEGGIDFRAAVERALRADAGPGVRELVLISMEESK